MKLSEATGKINTQLVDACIRIAVIDKNPKLFNSYDFKIVIKIFSGLYASTRKRHNPDLLIKCLIQNGVPEEWANDYALIWETICTLREKLRKR